MEHTLQLTDWDMDSLLQPFISVPDNCSDDASPSNAKLQDLHDPAELLHPSGTPPHCHPSPTHLPLLEQESNLASWDPSVLASLALPPMVTQCPSLEQDAFHEAHISFASPHAVSYGLHGAQGAFQATQDLPQETQESWSLQQLSQALQDVPDVLHEPQRPSGGSPAPSSPQDMLHLLEADVSGTGGAPASPARKGVSRRGRRASHSRREKLYQRTEPFEDPVQEKKRIDAINSKNNRDRRAKELQALRVKVERYTLQHDVLLQEVQELRQREADLLRQIQHAPASPAPPTGHPSSPPSRTPTPCQPTAPFTPLTSSPLRPATASPPPYHAHHITLTPPHTSYQALSRSLTSQ